MVKKKVINYVKSMLHRGYSASAIKNAMLKSSYSNKEIDAALNAAFNPTIRHEIQLSLSTILVVVLILAAMGGAVFFIYNSPKAPAQLLDLNLEPVTTTVKPGESIIFVKELSNLGSSERYDVIINQEIIDPETFNIITEKTETRAIETFGSTQTRMLMPEDVKAGDYILRVIVDYDNKKAVATLPIKIAAQEKEVIEKKPFEEEPIDCNDFNQCTNDVVENGECVNKPIVPCCGNNICEEQETCSADCQTKETVPKLPSTPTLDEIKEVAKSDPSKALRQCNLIEVPDLKDRCVGNIGEVQRNKNYCNQISSTNIKDLCYSNIAKSTNDNALCKEISADGRKDSCYMTFVLDNKDYSICDKLTNKDLRRTCESLRQLHELNQQVNQ